MSDWLDYAQYHPDSKHTVAGTLKVLAGLTSPQLADARDILVYLPPSYADAGRRFPVLYMHLLRMTRAREARATATLRSWSNQLSLVSIARFAAHRAAIRQASPALHWAV
jgi:hypothetical protein